MAAAVETPKVVIGGKSFQLAGLVDETALDTQMANVFKVLTKLNSLGETQAGQIAALQSKVLEIDPLAQRISSMHEWQEATAKRMNKIDENLALEARELGALATRVETLETNFLAVGQVQKEVAETNDHMSKLAADFAQLRLDARDALELSNDVKHFKTELQELQEDVTTVLHQAPTTERIISQVTRTVEESTEQLFAMSSKTAFMENSMSKMSQTVAEFTHMKQDLTKRIAALENPKVDRLGVVEEHSRAIAKQVGVLQHNWMSNWGAHEQSMQILKDDLMLHINQVRLSSRTEEVASGDAGSNCTFVRMDEEEKAVLRKQMDELHRALNILDNKKADYVQIMKQLDDKADLLVLDKKMDVTDFERRLENMQGVIDRWSSQHENTGLSRTPSNGAAPSDATTNVAQKADQVSGNQKRQLGLSAVDEAHQPSSRHPGAHVMERSGQQRPASTPPVLGGQMGQQMTPSSQQKGGKTTVRYAGSGQQVVDDQLGQTQTAQRHITPDARISKGFSRPASTGLPGSRQVKGRPPPGKIRPPTAIGMSGSPQIYLLGQGKDGRNIRQEVQPDPSLSLSAHSILPIRGAGGEDYIQLGNWETAASLPSSPMPLQPLLVKQALDDQELADLVEEVPPNVAGTGAPLAPSSVAA